MLGCVLHYTRAVLFLLLLALCMQSGRAAHTAKEKPTRDATPLKPRLAILWIFDKYPLVTISEAHGMREEADFIASLIRHPQFVEKVNDIVLEAGNWRYQPILDRYSCGQSRCVSVPRTRRDAYDGAARLSVVSR